MNSRSSTESSGSMPFFSESRSGDDASVGEASRSDLKNFDIFEVVTPDGLCKSCRATERSDGVCFSEGGMRRKRTGEFKGKKTQNALWSC